MMASPTLLWHPPQSFLRLPEMGAVGGMMTALMAVGAEASTAEHDTSRARLLMRVGWLAEVGLSGSEDQPKQLAACMVCMMCMPTAIAALLKWWGLQLGAEALYEPCFRPLPAARDGWTLGKVARAEGLCLPAKKATRQVEIQCKQIYSLHFLWVLVSCRPVSAELSSQFLTCCPRA